MAVTSRRLNQSFVSFADGCGVYEPEGILFKKNEGLDTIHSRLGNIVNRPFMCFDMPSRVVKRGLG